MRTNTMSKKPVAPKKVAPEANNQLVEAIIAVKHLQEFIQEHGSLEKSLGAVDRVYQLSQLTGGFVELKKALEIVGGGAPQEPVAAS